MSPMVRLGGVIGVALLAAVFLGLIARNMAAGHGAPPPPVAAAPAKPEVRVLVAARDLVAGDRLTTNDFAWQPWPSDTVNSAFIIDHAVTAGVPMPAAAPPGAVKIETAALTAAANKAHEFLVANDGGPAAKLVDAIVREPMLKGEPILEAKVVHAGAGGVMAVELTPGMRAMSVPLTAESAAGGFILPGDHVDVVQSRQTALGQGGEKHFTSETVLRNVKVLAIDQNAGKSTKLAQVGATATLEVSPEQAEVVALAKAQGELTLILRSYADIGGSTTVGVTKEKAPEDASDVVKVFRDGKPQDVQVAR
jgi:pilus assembly protein CpaB